MRKTLFDDNTGEHPLESKDISGAAVSKNKKEDRSLDRLKNLDEKIADAISKVKYLKEEKTMLERRIKELEAQLDERNQEVERLSSEKSSIKNQIGDLLNELDRLEIG